MMISSTRTGLTSPSLTTYGRKCNRMSPRGQRIRAKQQTVTPLLHRPKTETFTPMLSIPRADKAIRMNAQTARIEAGSVLLP